MTIADQLVASGMTDAAAAAKGVRFAAVDSAHASMHPASETRRRFWVPGRIEVLGKHTDYAGGRSLLCTVERGFCVVASPRSDRMVRVLDAATNAEASIVPGAPSWPPQGHWSSYAHTVVRRLARDFPPQIGADIAFSSDLPAAAGLSSSSALVIAIYLALAGVSDLAERATFRAIIPEADALAGYLGAVENGLPFGELAGDRGVGTFGGSEDHTAILRARAGKLAQYRFCPVTFERELPLPADHTFVIASSGIRAEKAGDALHAYNRLSSLSRAALDRWNALAQRNDACLGDAITACGADVVERLRGDSAELAERAEQFRIESTEIIPACACALDAGDLAAFGALVDRSMRNAEDMLRNQVPATILLARRARALGAVAASAFGAGFGGAVWALVPTRDAAQLCETLRDEYCAAFPQHAQAAEFFASPAGPPAQRLDER